MCNDYLINVRVFILCVTAVILAFIVAVLIYNLAHPSQPQTDAAQAIQYCYEQGGFPSINNDNVSCATSK